jgi:hypothetical protein
MPVVINELEVVPEPAQPAPVSQASKAEAGSKKDQEKPDFENLSRMWHQRRERIRAH